MSGLLGVERPLDLRRGEEDVDRLRLRRLSVRLELASELAASLDLLVPALLAERVPAG